MRNKDIKYVVILVIVLLIVFFNRNKLANMYNTWQADREPVTEQEASTVLSPIDSFNKTISENEDIGSTEFVFTEPVVKGDGSALSNDGGVGVVYLYLGEGIFYPISLPMGEDIVTDNSKYIYSKDNSISISVVSNVDIDKFSESVFIDNPISIKPNLIISDSGKNKPKEAAIHIVNDKAIIVRTYDNAGAFEVILKGLEEATYKVAKSGSISCNTIDKELPVYTGYHITVYPSLRDDYQSIYSFDSNSYLTISKELRGIADAKSLNTVKLSVIAGSTTATKVVETDKIYYVEIGDYVLGMYSVNFNTTYTCFGYGDESKYNTIAFLQSQE